MSTEILTPFPVFADVDGDPLDDGYIYIGLPNVDPVANPLACYWDSALTDLAVQPVRTRGGIPIKAGAQGRLFVGVPYSILVRNKNQFPVASLPQVIDFINDPFRVVNVLQFGAKGNGVTDDTVAIQAAIDSMPVAPLVSGEIVFPDMGSFYRITDTLHFGRFSVAANNNVQGFAFAPLELTVTLLQPIKWDGPDQPGSTKVVKTDTVGNYDLITDDKPMISVVACRGFKITGLLDAESVDTTRHAFSGIWFQGNHNVHSFEKFTVAGSPRIGVRHGCAWDLVGGVQYWGYADSPYYKANVYNAPALGGWQGDTQVFNACSLSGTLAHYTTESGQNLSIVMNAMNMGENALSAVYGIVMAGGRLTANGLSINQAGNTDVWIPTGSNSFTATDMHSESAAPVKVKTSTVPSSPHITIINSDSVSVTLAGGGAYLTIIDSDDVNIIRADFSARALITVIGSTVSGISNSNTGARDNVIINLSGCELVSAVLTGAAEKNCYLAAENCKNPENLPAHSSSFSTYKEDFNGLTHIVKNKIAIPHGVTTLVGTISTSGIGNSSTGTGLFKMNFSTGASANMASVFGLYSFAWTRDSGAVITLSAVGVVNEAKALDGFATFLPVVTVTTSGSDVLVNVSQTNNITADAVVELEGEVYVGGNFSTYLLPVWTPA